MKEKILIADQVHEDLIKGLESSLFEVTYQPGVTENQVIEIISDYHGFIVNSKVKCDKGFLNQASHLDFIARLGSGIDFIDLSVAKSLQIEVIRSPEGNANAVGEHTLGMLLSLKHNICSSDRSVRQMEWLREEHRGWEIMGSEIGIIGFGHTGPAFARKLAGLDVTINVYDPFHDQWQKEFPELRTMGLEELLNSSDVVSLHVPLTKQTDGMVDDTFIRKMKKGAVLINTSRGRMVEINALIKALDDGHLSGACLDVLENEKPDTWSDEEKRMYTRLFEKNNVVITPHIAGWTRKSLRNIAQVTLSKILKFYGR